MAGADRALIEKIAPVPVRQVMQIEAVSRIGNRAAHHSIVVAVEEIAFLAGDVFRAVDISVMSPLVSLFDQRFERWRWPDQAGAGSGQDRSDVAAEFANRGSLSAVIGPSRDNADAFDRPGPGGCELHSHESPGRDAGNRAFADVGI